MSNSLQPCGLATRLLCPQGFSRQEHWSGLPFPSLFLEVSCQVDVRMLLELRGQRTSGRAGEKWLYEGGICSGPWRQSVFSLVRLSQRLGRHCRCRSAGNGTTGRTPDILKRHCVAGRQLPFPVPSVMCLPCRESFHLVLGWF